MSDSDYRSRLDPAVETLGMTLVTIGDNNDAINDDEIVHRAATKLQMLYDMLVAAGVNEGILRAAVRS